MEAHIDLSGLEVCYYCDCGGLTSPHSWKKDVTEPGTHDLAAVIEHLRDRLTQHRITTKIEDRYAGLR